MNIFVEHPEKRIKLEDLYMLLVKYDKIYDSYPESYFEGQSIAKFINGQLANNGEIDDDSWEKSIKDLQFAAYREKVILE